MASVPDASLADQWVLSVLADPAPDRRLNEAAAAKGMTLFA